MLTRVGARRRQTAMSKQDDHYRIIIAMRNLRQAVFIDSFASAAIDLVCSSCKRLRRFRRDGLDRGQRAKSLRLDRENRIELAAEIFQGDDRREFHQFFL